MLPILSGYPVDILLLQVTNGQKMECSILKVSVNMDLLPFPTPFFFIYVLLFIF